jgi:hypothetical protein
MDAQDFLHHGRSSQGGMAAGPSATIQKVILHSEDV